VCVAESLSHCKGAIEQFEKRRNELDSEMSEEIDIEFRKQLNLQIIANDIYESEEDVLQRSEEIESKNQESDDEGEEVNSTDENISSRLLPSRALKLTEKSSSVGKQSDSKSKSKPKRKKQELDEDVQENTKAEEKLTKVQKQDTKKAKAKATPEKKVESTEKNRNVVTRAQAKKKNSDQDVNLPQRPRRALKTAETVAAEEKKPVLKKPSPSKRESENNAKAKGNTKVASHDKSEESKEKEIEKFVKHREFDGEVQYQVKWRGFPNSYNSWVLEKDIPKSAKKLLDLYRS
jgi:hypothetical protein